MDWVTYSLAQWSALANGNLITLLNTESWRDVRSEVLVSLLVSGVFGDEVEVFSADDEGSVHLGGDDGSGQDTATDGDEAGEGALLVCNESASVSSSSTFLQFRNFIISSLIFRTVYPISSFSSPSSSNKNTTSRAQSILNIQRIHIPM